MEFVYRHRPSRTTTTALEVGCGAGNNLWFLAREGVRSAGIDASASAVEAAQRRLAADGLAADIRLGDYTDLPWPDRAFDLVIDRGALTCASRPAALVAVEEIRRTLRPGGRFLFNPFSTDHTSAASGRPGAGDVRIGITEGTLQGVGQICFYSRADIDRALHLGWKQVSRDHLIIESMDQTRHSEWRVVAERLF